MVGPSAKCRTVIISLRTNSLGALVSNLLFFVHSFNVYVVAHHFEVFCFRLFQVSFFGNFRSNVFDVLNEAYTLYSASNLNRKL